MKILRSRYLQLKQETGDDVPVEFGMITPNKKIHRNYSSSFMKEEDKEPTNKSPVVTRENSTIAFKNLLEGNNDYTDSSFTTTTTTTTNTTTTTDDDTSFSSNVSFESNCENKIKHQTSQKQLEHNGTGNSVTTSNSEMDSIKITVLDMPENAKVKVHIHPVDMDSAWLGTMYRKYENDLWRRSLRDTTDLKKKWVYHCLLCQQTVMKFETLKYHLNIHLKLRPYVCKLCGQSFSNRLSAVKHLQKLHGIYTRYNFFIGN